MCQSFNLIEEVVSQRVNGNEMFTAFDISRAVQALQKNRGLPFERHRDMRGDIHTAIQAYVDSGVYHKVSIDVGLPQRPFLYFADGTDPKQYVAVGLSPNQAHVQVHASAIDPSLQNPQNVVSGDNRRPDARGTLCVPADLIRNCSFNTRDIAYVYASYRNNQNHVVVTKQVPAGYATLATYTVDDNFNVRITRATLEDAGLANNSQTDVYEFEQIDNSVYVRLI